jgi:hypothetical protein
VLAETAGSGVSACNPPFLSTIDLPHTQPSRLAVFGGFGMSFNICRGMLGSLAMFPDIYI